MIKRLKEIILDRIGTNHLVSVRQMLRNVIPEAPGSLFTMPITCR